MGKVLRSVPPDVCLSVAAASHVYLKEQFVTTVVTMGNSEVRQNPLMLFIL